MKLAVYCIGGLSQAILPYVRFAALDSMAIHDLSSTTPAVPLTAWTSAWTGLAPEHHGRVPGIKGRKPKQGTVWEELGKRDIAVELYDEDNLGATGDEDVAVYRVDSLCHHIVNGNLEEAQLLLHKLDGLIAGHGDIPCLIISAIGAAKYSTGLNVDRLLIARGMMLTDSRGMINYTKSSAYPANYTGKKPRPTHGIMVNSLLRKGFVEDMQTMTIAGELLMSLNRTDGIQAMAAHQHYDISAVYYDDMPDVVLRSPMGRTCFLCSGQKDAPVIMPYTHFGLSDVGMLAASSEEVIAGIQDVTECRKAIRKAVKMAGIGGKDE